jgi:hypothetical protein
MKFWGPQNFGALCSPHILYNYRLGPGMDIGRIGARRGIPGARKSRVCVGRIVKGENYLAREGLISIITTLSCFFDLVQPSTSTGYKLGSLKGFSAKFLSYKFLNMNFRPRSAGKISKVLWCNLPGQHYRTRLNPVWIVRCTCFGRAEPNNPLCTLKNLSG